MRSARIVIAFLALVLTATMSMTASSASARVDGRPAPGISRTAVDPGAPRATVPIAITSRVVKKRIKPDRPKQLVFQGTVEPRTGPVWIQRATSCDREKRTCNFKFYAKRYLHQGRYQVVIDAPPSQRSWLWRAKVKTSYGEIWQTCTKRKAQDCKIPYRAPK